LLSNPQTARAAWLVIAMLLLAGCAGPPRDPTAQLPAEVMIDEALNESKAFHTEPAPKPSRAVEDVLLSARISPLSQPRDTFNLAVKDMDAPVFFYSLVAGTDTNIVVHPKVEGSISLSLKDVTLEQVLNIVRDVYGYEFKRESGIYTIFPRELRTEVFSVDYLDIQRVGVSDTSVQIGKIESNNRNGNGSQNNQSGGSGDQMNLLSMLEGEENRNQSNSNQMTPGARIQTLNRTDFWRSLEQTILAMLDNSGGDRMVMINPQAGLVVVKALPHELNDVRHFLERSELSIKRQVILETKIIEVRLSESFKAGIDWNAISGQLLLTNNTDQFSSSFEILSQAAGAGTIFSSLLAVDDITNLLDLLEKQGAVQVLSSPRVSTVNNQKAVIRVGSDEFFVTGLSSNTVSNASSTTSSPDIELSSFFSGIALDVTPQIADNGEVILHVHPVVSKVKDQPKDLTIGDSQFSLPLALRDVRESDSIVRARSGQVVVLGGLMQETLSRDDGKNPGLGDIPVVDNLFKTRNDLSLKTELVILMRPIIVDSNQSWSDDISGAQQRMKGLGNFERSRLQQ